MLRGCLAGEVRSGESSFEEAARPTPAFICQDVDSDCLFGDCSQRAVSRFGCGKSSVIKQTLEMQSEDASATRDPLKEACLPRGVWVNS
jgi:hypothetical protein